VDGWVVDGDDADDVVTFELDHFVHATLLGVVPGGFFELRSVAAFLAFGSYSAIDFAVRNLIPHLDTEGYFEARPLSTNFLTTVSRETRRQENRDRSQLRRSAVARPRRVARVPTQ